jgi:hypothetical protein
MTNRRDGGSFTHGSACAKSASRPAGPADYFIVDIPPIAVLFVVLAVMGGAGVVIYLAMRILFRRNPGRPA